MDVFDNLDDIASAVDEAISELSEPTKIDYTKGICKIAGIVSVAIPSFIYGTIRLIRYLRIKAAIREAGKTRKER